MPSAPHLAQRTTSLHPHTHRGSAMGLCLPADVEQRQASVSHQNGVALHPLARLPVVGMGAVDVVPDSHDRCWHTVETSDAATQATYCRSVDSTELPVLASPTRQPHLQALHPDDVCSTLLSQVQHLQARPSAPLPQSPAVCAKDGPCKQQLPSYRCTLCEHCTHHANSQSMLLDLNSAAASSMLASVQAIRNYSCRCCSAYQCSHCTSVL